MTEESKTSPKQDYVYHTDQQVSVNAFIDIDVEGEQVRFQVTNRYGSTTEKILATTRAAIDAYKELRKAFPRMVTEPQTVTPSEPTYTPIDDNGNKLPEIKVATAGKLEYEDKNGKLYWKIVDCTFAPGERGTKYGMNVWPEVYEGAGLNLETGQPVPNIQGWRVEYVCNEKGYPSKVTRLLPPKQ